MLLKFKATKIDELEKTARKSVQELATDGTLNSLALFIEKGLVNGNGMIGCSRSVALEEIDNYLEEPQNDLDNLRLDIMEALVDAGFLSRQLNVKAIRESAQKKIEEIKKEI